MNLKKWGILAGIIVVVVCLWTWKWAAPPHAFSTGQAVLVGPNGKVRLSQAETSRIAGTLPYLPGAALPAPGGASSSSFRSGLETIREVQQINEQNRKNASLGKQ